MSPDLKAIATRALGPSAAVLGLLLSAALGLGAGCAAKDANFVPGRSDGPEPSPLPEPSASASAIGRWEHLDELKKLAIVRPEAPSRGHYTGAMNAAIRANAQASEHFGKVLRTQQYPQGTLFVQEHRYRGSGVREGFFAMEKREPGFFPTGGDWEFVVLGPEGAIQERGKLEGCARCHADAEADFVFVPPHP